MTVLPRIQLTSGLFWDFTKPEPLNVKLDDIVTALTRIPRFNGHGEFFYSVAQHSLLVADLVPEEFAYEALLHDAGEAYTGDITLPLKTVIGADYHAIEDSANHAIREAFGLPEADHWSPEVKAADKCALWWEAITLFGRKRVEAWGIEACTHDHPRVEFIPGFTGAGKRPLWVRNIQTDVRHTFRWQIINRAQKEIRLCASTT